MKAVFGPNGMNFSRRAVTGNNRAGSLESKDGRPGRDGGPGLNNPEGSGCPCINRGAEGMGPDKEWRGGGQRGLSWVQECDGGARGARQFTGRSIALKSEQLFRSASREFSVGPTERGHLEGFFCQRKEAFAAGGRAAAMGNGFR